MRLERTHLAESRVAVSEQEYRKIALEQPDERWELHCGALRRKPDMSVEHNYAGRRLMRLLIQQLDPRAYDVVPNMSRVRISPEHYYIPDLFVVPMRMVQQARQRPRELEVYVEPLPLVVEIWSPSTGTYDVETKLPEYQRRGDAEIWRIHPYDRTLTSWRRNPDGTYSHTVHQDAVVEPIALPGVRIELEALFE